MGVVFHWQVAGDIGDVHLCAHRQGTGLEAAVNQLRVLHHRLGRRRAYPPLQANVGGYGINRLAALGHYAVDSNRILAPENLPVAVNGLERKGGRVQGIDAQMGGAAGVGASAQKLHVLDHVAVAGAADGKLVVAHIAGRVAHHRQVNVVEFAQPD